MFHAISKLMHASGLECHLLACFAVLGLLLIVGLGTPIAAVLIAIQAARARLAARTDAWHSLLQGALGAGPALLGPGARSIDARLFGWKRIEIPHAKTPSRPPF